MKYSIIQIKDIGWTAVSWTEKGLSALTLPCTSPEEALEKLQEYADLAQLNEENNDRTLLSSLKNELTKYFNGEGSQLNFPVDLGWCTTFQHQVLSSIRNIPYGETRSYRQVAEMLNKPTAARAVGGALRNNRVLLIVPCHRVIKSDGSLGGFGGIENSNWKQKFLDIEKPKF